MRSLKIYMASLGFRSALYPLLTPPLGIMCLASYLREKFDTDIIARNFMKENLEKMLAANNLQLTPLPRT